DAWPQTPVSYTCNVREKRVALPPFSRSATLGPGYRSRQTFLALLCKPLLDKLVHGLEILALNGGDNVLGANVDTVEDSGKLPGIKTIGPGGKDHLFEIRQPQLVDPLLVNAHLFVL